MCEPVTIGLMVTAVVATVAQNVEQNKANRRYEKALKKSQTIQAEQIADEASAEMNERAREVRSKRASARAVASGAGINLSSGSFIAQLQSYDQQLDESAGLVTKNMQNSILGSESQRDAALSGISYKNGLGMAIDAGAAAGGAYMSAGAPGLGGTSARSSAAPAKKSGTTTKNFKKG